jgi:nucleoside-diphosphate-sugar epimerase
MSVDDTKMKYSITGNKGLIGTFLKKELDKQYDCVLNIDKKDGFDVNNLNNARATQYIDIMFHLAAQCKINEAIRNPSLPHYNNADGTFQVLEFCRKHAIPKVVIASSSRVLSPERNPYVASKIYAEELTRAYTECYGLEHLIIRPSTVYGSVLDVTSRLMHDWCQLALRDEELPLYGDKNKTLDFTYVTDFVDGVMLLVDNWNKTKNRSFNISGGQETNLYELAQMIIEEAKGGYVKLYPQELAQPQQVRVDISDITKLGYKPKIGIEEGVKKMIEFYRRKNE